MNSEQTRFKGIFNADDTITGFWELASEGGEWQPWMEIGLLRTAWRSSVTDVAPQPASRSPAPIQAGSRLPGW